MDFTQNIRESKFELFSTPIWGFILNNERYHIYNYIEEIEELIKTKPIVKKSNMGGYQTYHDLDQNPVFRELCETIISLSNNIIKEYMPNSLAVLDGMWANVNDSRDYNAAHVHGGVLSGVFYLKVPKKSGNLVLINPAVRSDSSVIRMKNYVVEPKECACIIFPSWLEHYVESNESNEERISISFNVQFREYES